MAQPQNGDDPPLGSPEGHLHDQQLQGDDTVPFPLNTPLQGGDNTVPYPLNTPLQGGDNTVPSPSRNSSSGVATTLSPPPLETPLQGDDTVPYPLNTPLQGGDNTVPYPLNTLLQGGDNTVPYPLDTLLQGGYSVPSSIDPPLQGGHAAPSTAASMTFPKCGHVIAGDMYDYFLTRRDSDCPICQLGEFQLVMKFASCEHVIVGDPLRRVFRSRTYQCPVCIPPSNEDEATDTQSSPISPIQAVVHTESSRVTLNKYQDPFTFEGVKKEIFIGKDEKARLRVDDKVWKKWPKKKRDLFVYCTNIRFNQPAGESQQAPTNPGNPNHPEYKPTSTASIMRRNLKRKPDPEKVAAAIRRLLATPDKDVVARKANLRPFDGGDA